VAADPALGRDRVCGELGDPHDAAVAQERFPNVPREAELLNALRPFAIPPGDYFIPRAAGMQEMRSPEFKEKMKQGPVALLTVMPTARFPWADRSRSGSCS